MNTFFLSLFALLIFTASCSQEGSSRVRYKVSCSNCDVAYLSGSVFFEPDISGSWSQSLRLRSGEDFYVAATKNGSFGSVSVEVSIDGVVYDSRSSNAPFASLRIEGVIP